MRIFKRKPLPEVPRPLIGDELRQRAFSNGWEATGVQLYIGGFAKDENRRSLWIDPVGKLWAFQSEDQLARVVDP